MSTEVSDAAVDELTDAVLRHFNLFPDRSWVDTATAVVKANGTQAAAQLAPGETVEWLTPGIMHRHGKLWPGAILLVTPYRTIITATRGSLRARSDISALYRGPETLLGVSNRLLPGTSKALWMLELASDQGPFIFAFPETRAAQELAETTSVFVSGRATYVRDGDRILVDGVQADLSAPSTPTSEPAPAIEVPETPAALIDPFAAARADLAASMPAHDEDPSTMVMPAAAEEQVASPMLESETVYQPFTAPGQPAPFVPQQRTSSDPLGDPWHPFEPVAEERAPDPDPEPEPVAVLAPPDWYEDPIGTAKLRYWDGGAWTDHIAG